MQRRVPRHLPPLPWYRARRTWRADVDPRWWRRRGHKTAAAAAAAAAAAGAGTDARECCDITQLRSDE
jgi:hypothetical protein